MNAVNVSVINVWWVDLEVIVFDMKLWNLHSLIRNHLKYPFSVTSLPTISSFKSALTQHFQPACGAKRRISAPLNPVTLAYGTLQVCILIDRLLGWLIDSPWRSFVWLLLRPWHMLLSFHLLLNCCVPTDVQYCRCVTALCNLYSIIFVSCWVLAENGLWHKHVVLVSLRSRHKCALNYCYCLLTRGVVLC